MNERIHPKVPTHLGPAQWHANNGLEILSGKSCAYRVKVEPNAGNAFLFQRCEAIAELGSVLKT